MANAFITGIEGLSLSGTERGFLRDIERLTKRPLLVETLPPGLESLPLKDRPQAKVEASAKGHAHKSHATKDHAHKGDAPANGGATRGYPVWRSTAARRHCSRAGAGAGNFARR